MRGCPGTWWGTRSVGQEGEGVEFMTRIQHMHGHTYVKRPRQQSPFKVQAMHRRHSPSAFFNICMAIHALYWPHGRSEIPIPHLPFLHGISTLTPTCPFG